MSDEEASEKEGKLRLTTLPEEQHAAPITEYMSTKNNVIFSSPRTLHVRTKTFKSSTKLYAYFKSKVCEHPFQVKSMRTPISSQKYANTHFKSKVCEHKFQVKSMLGTETSRHYGSNPSYKQNMFFSSCQYIIFKSNFINSVKSVLIVSIHHFHSQCQRSKKKSKQTAPLLEYIHEKNKIDVSNHRAQRRIKKTSPHTHKPAQWCILSV